jgi:hypothetical protein
MQAVAAPTIILREPHLFWAELRTSHNLNAKAVALSVVSVVSLAIYGAILGSSHSALQAASSAFKLPVLYMACMLICFPTLHILNLLFGSKHSPMQLLVLLLASMALTSTLMLAFAPVSAFFIMTSTHYAFIKLLNVAIMGLTAILGVRFLYKGMQEISVGQESLAASRDKLLRFWIILYAFVGSQLAWTLRPFFGSPTEPFEWVRQVGGNFYTDVLRTFGDLFGGWITVTPWYQLVGG